MNPVICIGRQIGAGGHVIGRMLAEEFGAAYYDREILNLAARESGFKAEFFEQNDERKGFLRTLLPLPLTHSGSGVGPAFYQSDFSQEGLFKFQSDAIRKAAAEGPCVFVGRCADYVLRDVAGMVSVFVTAPLEERVRLVMEEKNMSCEEATRHITQVESRRASYYNYYTGKKWGAAGSYNLCIDSSILGTEATERLIASFIRKRFNL